MCRINDFINPELSKKINEIGNDLFHNRNKTITEIRNEHTNNDFLRAMALAFHNGLSDSSINKHLNDGLDKTNLLKETYYNGLSIYDQEKYLFYIKSNKFSRLVANIPFEREVDDILIKPYLRNLINVFPKYTHYDKFSYTIDCDCIPDIHFDDFLNIELKVKDFSNFTDIQIWRGNWTILKESEYGYLLVSNRNVRFHSGIEETYIIDINKAIEAGLVPIFNGQKYIINKELFDKMKQYAYTFNEFIEHLIELDKSIFIDLNNKIIGTRTNTVYSPNCIYKEIRHKFSDNSIAIIDLTEKTKLLKSIHNSCTVLGEIDDFPCNYYVFNTRKLDREPHNWNYLSIDKNGKIDYAEINIDWLKFINVNKVALIKEL